MSKKIIPIAAALFMTAASAQNVTSNGFSYDYIDGGRQTTNVDFSIQGEKFEADYTGAGVSISKLIDGNVFITAGFASASANSLKIDSISYNIKTDVSETSFGIGYRMPLSAQTDLNVQAISSSTKAEASGYGLSISDTDRVTSFGAQIRHKINDAFELNADIGSYDGEIGTGVGAVMNLSKSIAVIGRLNSNDEAKSTLVGLRVMY
jgi:hypothetical protein